MDVDWLALKERGIAPLSESDRDAVNERITLGQIDPTTRIRERERAAAQTNNVHGISRRRTILHRQCLNTVAVGRRQIGRRKLNTNKEKQTVVSRLRHNQIEPRIVGRLIIQQVKTVEIVDVIARMSNNINSKLTLDIIAIKQ
jgi:hypothetical protein